MAKILLVSEKINPTVWELVKSLKSQQHELVLLTSYGEQPPSPVEGLDLMTYFKKWSAVEALKLAPVLINMQTQILHFILESDRLSAAHLVLWGLSQTPKKTIFGMSLLHVERGLRQRNILRFLLQHSDIVTCPSPDTLAQLRGLHVRADHQGRGLLPPVLTHATDSADESHELESLLEGERFVIRPFRREEFQPEEDFFKDLLLIAQKHKIVFLGSQDEWPLRERKRFQQWMADRNLEHQWMLTGTAHRGEIESLVSRCEALWLADLDLTPLELTEYFTLALKNSVPLILDAKQARLHTPMWRHGVNCWVISGKEKQKILEMENYRLHFKSQESSMEPQSLIDAPINELNRLYSRALK